MGKGRGTAGCVDGMQAWRVKGRGGRQKWEGRERTGTNRGSLRMERGQKEE